MTDTTTLDEPGDGTPAGDESLEPLVENPVLGAGVDGGDDAVKTRLLLPFLLPALSMAIVAVLVLNISRLFLAGSSDAAVVIGIIITLAILGGASLIAALPRLRTATLAMILGAVLLLVSGAGLVALGPSLDDGEGGATSSLVNPPGQPVGTVSVTAGPGFTFDGVADTGNYSAPSGVVKIDYGGDSGHTLAIQDPKYAAFELGTSPGTKHSATVLLNPGTYTIYCTVPGHEAAGMKATITIAPK
ncbi:MAG TPA: plastocyanin/azurin family copper-binding protein [Acidimicrobiia bacterium]